MRISIINAHDTNGGAARSAYRLHRGLIEAGVASTFFTQVKKSDDATVRKNGSKLGKVWDFAKPLIDSMPARLYRARDKSSPFSSAICPTSRWLKQAGFNNADLINLHWIAEGFISIESLRQIAVPLVWTLHDSWPFTGGCHLPLNCQNFSSHCGGCFRLGSNNRIDLSRLIFERKAHAWAHLDMTIVAPSNWMAQSAKKSALFINRRIEVIPNGLDLQRYKPLGQELCKQILGIPLDTKVILFSAQSAVSDKNKGFQFIQPALSVLKNNCNHKNLMIVVCGESQPVHAPEFGFPVRYMGRLHDDTALAVLYSAADVMLVPSMQENLPNTIMEAMACGTPVVAFNIGGIPDMVEHQRNGYLAQPFDIQDLARGLSWVLEDLERRKAISAKSREKIENNFSLPSVAKQYQSLFEELVSR